jgi:hypothetical protein
MACVANRGALVICNNRRLSESPANPYAATAYGESSQWLAASLAIILVGGCLFNNIIRWYPFPVGRSANEVVGLEDNLAGIIVNISFFGVALISAMIAGGARVPKGAASLVGVYCAFILGQAFVREEVLLEALRSLAWTMHFAGAIYLGDLVGRRPALLRQSLGLLLAGQCASVVCGLAIAVAKPGSVNLGMGHSWEFHQYSRGEFFFLWVPPVLTVALGVAWLRVRGGGVVWRRWVVAGVVATVVLLSLLTMTRTFVFGILLVLLAAGVYVKRFSVMAVVSGVVGAVFISERVFTDALLFLRVISDDPLVEFTGGRQELNVLLLETFLGSPWIGVGAQEVRGVIATSAVLAKSEHGYTSHLASFGVVATLYFIYMAHAAMCALRELWKILIGRYERGLEMVPVVACLAGLALFTVSSGFIGLLGAASSYGDWLGVFLIQVFLGLSSRWDRNDGMSGLMRVYLGFPGKWLGGWNSIGRILRLCAH